MTKIVKSDAEWKQLLTPMQYEVTRHAATEAPGSGEYVDHDEHGIYTCVCCGTPLFESDTKFDAGCGWPSYFKALDPANVREVVDTSHGMRRTEVDLQRRATRISATCFPTARRRPACATASTRRRSGSIRNSGTSPESGAA